MRARRVLLYVPGSDERKIVKAAGLNVDSICLDLEDAVAPNRKTEARAIVARMLREQKFGRSERLARINALGSGQESEDLDAVLPSHPDGIVVPKISRPDQVRWVSEQIAAAEDANGWELHSIRMIVLVESALGVMNSAEIACSDPRLDALLFGAEDLAADLGVKRTREGWEVFHARSAVVLAAAAYGIQALDMVDTNYRDLEGLYQDAQRGAEMGFAGKQIIHPDQIGPVELAFTPSDEEIEQARQMVQQFEEQKAAGAGVFGVEGKMVEMPIVKAAERVLARARAAGKIS